MKWYSSRKVRLVLIGLLSLLLGLGVTALVPATAAAYATYAGSVVTLVLGYNVANTTQDWIQKGTDASKDTDGR